jgi:serine/threonine protein phosphatase PrpC
MIEIGHISHPGNIRTLNEDSYDIDNSAGIAVLVDGMGGPNAGDIASAFGRSEVHKSLLQGDTPIAALANAGNALRLQKPQMSGKPSGASAIAVQWDDRTIDLAWLGSCRAWHYDGVRTELVSDMEHKPVGTNTPVQALGVTSPDKLSLFSKALPWQRGHAVLLCSDGILEESSDTFIHEILANSHVSAQESVETLLLRSLQGKAANNLTAIVLRNV